MVELGAMLTRDVAPGVLVEHARAVEAALDELWIVEDLPYAGGIAQLGAVLGAVGADVAVGHGIAPAPFRTVAALAMEWSALAAMYPTRVRCGIGHGVQNWMAQIGARVDSPLTLLRETVLAVRSLLAGDEVSVDGRYVHLDAVRLVHPPLHVPEIAIGAMGPRSLELSGEVADGTILPEGHGPAEIERARSLIATGRRRGDHDRAHRLTVFAGFYCGDPAGLGPLNPDAPVGWDAIGTEPAAVVAQLQTLIDAGADSVVLVPFGADRTAQLQLAGAEIVPALVR